MYEIAAEQVLDAAASKVWDVLVDVAAWPQWDPHEQAARLDGPFAVGTTGWTKPRGAPAASWTITAVEPQRSWSTRCSLPMGALISTVTLTPQPDGGVRCSRTMTVSGPLVSLFRLWFGPRIRRDLALSLPALQARVATSGCTHGG